MKQFGFTQTGQDKQTKARLGKIHTPHGDIETPAFVPVGTQATVKSLTPEEIKTVGTQLFFVNTYHMAMRPGIEVVEKFGGLHAFMKSPCPIITDSGGFQVFSLARQPKTDNLQPTTGYKIDKLENQTSNLVKITEDGVVFRSHWDGTQHEFTPETSMEYQWRLGSDIHIAFDDCTPYPITYEEAKKSMERTHRWAQRSLEAHIKLTTRHSRPGSMSGINSGGNDRRLYQALYGSIQGSVFEDLRKESAQFISEMDFDGIAIGGVSVGESKQEMRNVLDWVMPFLPDQKPRHLLGVGEIDDIFSLIAAGVDTFDCVLPTRMARNGSVYCFQPSAISSQRYILDINKGAFAEDSSPIDEMCSCYTCQNFSRGYIHHLFKVRELLGYRLATIHNLTFIHTLVKAIRKSIHDNTFIELQNKWLG